MRVDVPRVAIGLTEGAVGAGAEVHGEVEEVHNLPVGGDGDVDPCGLQDVRNLFLLYLPLSSRPPDHCIAFLRRFLEIEG